MTSFWWERYARPRLLPRYRQRGRLARAIFHELSGSPSGSGTTVPAQQADINLRPTLRLPAVVHPAAAVDSGRTFGQVRKHLSARIVRHLFVSVLVLGVILGEAIQPWFADASFPWQNSSMLSGLDYGDHAETPAPVFYMREGEAVPVLDSSAAIIAPPVQVSRFEQSLVFPFIHLPAEHETLADVAARYDVSVESLIWSNGLQTGDVLALGQELRIPLMSGVPYVVQPDDTLETVAARFSVTPDAIWLFKPNHIKPGDSLTVGQEIFIPNGSAPLPEALLALYGGPDGLGAIRPQPAGVIREVRTNMREGPDRVYAQVARLDTGRRVRLLARHADWVKVEVAGISGWIQVDLLDIPLGLTDTLVETSDFPPPPPIWVWPAYGAITSPFGPRWGGFHNGLDIANGAWTPIHAARSGQVIEAGWCSGYGYCVKIAHAGGIETVYGHLIDQPVVGVGEAVRAGDVIGNMGSTYDAKGGGYSTGVHLHFEVRVYGRAVNPLNFLP